MSALRGETRQHKLFRAHIFCCSIAFLALFAYAPRTFSQTKTAGSIQATTETEGQAQSQADTPLQDLLNEAERNNPQIRAARQGWQSAKQVPSQVSTLPDPQFQIQQFSVGSPRPFAGYTNSDFAYFGLGVSQTSPIQGNYD